MKCVWWLMFTWSLARVRSEAMLKEGDNYSLECSSPGWKYCSWKHEVSLVLVKRALEVKVMKYL